MDHALEASLAEVKKESGQMVRFGVAGAVCVGTYYALLIGLTELFGVWYMASAIMAFAVYFVVQFSLHKFWTFNNRDRTYIKRQLVLYSFMALGNWVVNTALLYVLVEFLHMWYVLAQIILTIIVSILAYIGFRRIFHHRQPL